MDGQHQGVYVHAAPMAGAVGLRRQLERPAAALLPLALLRPRLLPHAHPRPRLPAALPRPASLAGVRAPLHLCRGEFERRAWML